MNWNLRTWRSGLRLTSALIMLAFVICHLVAHSFLLVSIALADPVRDALMAPWRTWIGTVILSAAVLVHYGNALWSIYIWRSLRLNRWEWAQLSLGLCIPLLLIPHIASTRIAESMLDVNVFYTTMFIVLWVLAPWLGVVQALAVLANACQGEKGRT